MSSPVDLPSPTIRRPSEHAILEQFRVLVRDPVLSASHTRRKASDGSIGPAGDANLRSLYWRLYLNVLSPSSAVWPDALKRLRRHWVDLHDYLRGPDGKWIDGVVPPKGWTGNNINLPTFDPLGNEPGNPWPAWYEDLELRRIIRQDVERTFPDNPYFRIPRVKESMTNILFCYAKLHVDVSYRQGMHEILAIILWCTDLDSVEPASSSQDKDSLARLVLSRDFVEHDAYSLFNVLMTSMLSWYDHTSSVSCWVGNNNAYNTTSGMTLVQPIVAKCARVHDLLKKVDFELWKRMEELKIEPQIYGIRWLRLLFSREFPMDASLQLWDMMFAEDLHPVLHIVDYICLAMLLRIRESLLDADYSTFLQGLLRYPLPADGNPRMPLLVQQASYLRDNTTNFGGAYVRRQNQQNGADAGIRSGTRAEEAMYERQSAIDRTPGTPGTPGKQTPATSALIDQGRSLAEGLYGRAEALGINKAVFSALGDLRKSVQSYQAQQTSQTTSEISSGAWNGEMAHNRSLDIKRLRAENLAMGNALAASLQILRSELVQSGQPTSQVAEASFGAIQHITDVLMGSKSTFDTSFADRLVGTASRASSSLLPDAKKPLPPRTQTPNLLDDTSPTLASTEQFMPLGRSTFSYPVAPRRTPSLQSPPLGHQGSSLQLPPKPLQTHHPVGHPHANGHVPFPDLGDWQNVPPLSDDPLTGSSLLPRQPALIRPGRGMDGGRQTMQGAVPLNTIRPDSQLSPSRQSTDSMDPLGVLF